MANRPELVLTLPAHRANLLSLLVDTGIRTEVAAGRLAPKAEAEAYELLVAIQDLRRVPQLVQG